MHFERNTYLPPLTTSFCRSVLSGGFSEAANPTTFYSPFPATIPDYCDDYDYDSDSDLDEHDDTTEEINESTSSEPTAAVSTNTSPDGDAPLSEHAFPYQRPTTSQGKYSITSLP